jgi:predicted MPP superfamily phosphohydrolase
VAAAAWVVRQAHRLCAAARSRTPPASLPEPDPASVLVDFGRRGFLQTATVAAGTLPFVCGGYGFVIGRRQYQVSEVALLVGGLPPGFEGLRIVQLSDIHIGSYMSASEVGRIVGMANELAADLAVVTILSPGQAIRCATASASFHGCAPVGVWGCNGNHEIYAGAEGVAAGLFARHGMHLLRQENVELVRHGQSLNLIGVDYQRPRNAQDRPLAMLDGLEPLLRRDMPNILLSHNPNAFPRAAELGVELTLAGHTHGGQVKVEILEDWVSPARFLTRYIAGLFERPLGAAAELEDEQAWAAAPARPASLLYVNRGLGTIFAPIRLGVPPEIFLLRCAAHNCSTLARLSLPLRVVCARCHNTFLHGQCGALADGELWGNSWVFVMRGWTNGWRRPARTGPAMCPRCIWRARVWSRKRWSTWPGARRLSRNWCAAK